MGKLADAYVEVSARDQQLNRDLATTRGRLTSFVSEMKSTMAIPLAIGGAAASAFSTGAIAKASDLNETLSKTNTVFGDSAAVVIGQAEELSKKFGVVRNDALAAASNIGLIAQASGLSQAAAADLSARFTKLAADAGSFFNVPMADALEKIRAGLVGESEPIRAFGVLLNEAAVQSEALALGLVKSTKEMTEASKVQARASLITKGLATATGDLERTADSTSNQMKKLWGQIEETQTEIGAKLLPVMNELLPVATQLGTELATALDSEGVKSLAGALTEVAGLIAKINQMSEEGGGRGMLGQLWKFGPVLGLRGMVGAALDGGAQKTMDANAKPFPFMADHEAERAKADAASAAANKWVIDWGNAIAKDADAETRKLMAMPVNDAAAAAARARGFKVDHVDALAWNAVQKVGLWEGLDSAGKLAASIGRGMLKNTAGRAGGLARAALGAAGAMAGNAVEPTRASWTDMISASKQLQLDALRGEDPAKQVAAKLDRANGLLAEIKEGIATAVRRPTERLGAILRGPE